MPQIFRARSASRQPTRQRGAPRTPYRERGYDARWDRRSKAFRRAHPFCRFCEQQDRLTLAVVVDHIIPVVDRPELLHDEGNLQSLCAAHHAGLKSFLEREARKIGDLDLLLRWSEDPSSRPIWRGEPPRCW